MFFLKQYHTDLWLLQDHTSRYHNIHNLITPGESTLDGYDIMANSRNPLFRIWMAFSLPEPHCWALLNWMYVEKDLHTNPNPIEFCFDLRFTHHPNQFSWANWMTKLTLKGNTISYCLYLADPASFLASDSVLGPYFPLRTACLFSSINSLYLCNITSLPLYTFQFWVWISSQKLCMSSLWKRLSLGLK